MKKMNRAKVDDKHDKFMAILRNKEEDFLENINIFMNSLIMQFLNLFIKITIKRGSNFVPKYSEFTITIIILIIWTVILFKGTKDEEFYARNRWYTVLVMFVGVLVFHVYFILQLVTHIKRQFLEEDTDNNDVYNLLIDVNHEVSVLLSLSIGFSTHLYILLRYFAGAHSFYTAQATLLKTE